jgi:hypothetical protein
MFSVSTLASRHLQRNLAASTRSFSSLVPDKPDKDIISKKDIVQEIAETHDLTFATSERIVNSVLGTIVQVRGRKIYLFSGVRAAAIFEYVRDLIFVLLIPYHHFRQFPKIAWSDCLNLDPFKAFKPSLAMVGIPARGNHFRFRRKNESDSRRTEPTRRV